MVVVSGTLVSRFSQANFVAQSQRENLPAGVPVPAEVRFRY